MDPDPRPLIERFLRAGPWAVVGASRSRAKYGNKVLRAYLRKGMRVFAVNPQAQAVEGLRSFLRLADLPERVLGVSIITPPEITENIVEEAAAAGARSLWMQPGAESDSAIRRAQELGLEVIADGSCFLVVTGFREDGGEPPA